MAIGREDVPQRLYKYFTPDRIDVLDNAMLRYTPLSAFNDPFEGRPDVSELTADSILLDQIRSLAFENARTSYAELPAPVRKKLTYEAYMSLLKEQVNGAAKSAIGSYRAASERAKTQLLNTMDSLIGALCLTEEPDNLLMWPHYASSHEGFVVEFDAHHDYFHSQRSEQDEFFRLRRVTYRGARPNLDLQDVNGINLFLIKSSGWSYENEWRVLRPLAAPSRRIDASPFPIALFDFPRDAVRSVVLGARATPETTVNLQTILASHQEYAAVQLRRAVPDLRLFRLTFEDLPR